MGKEDTRPPNVKQNLFECVCKVYRETESRLLFSKCRRYIYHSEQERRGDYEFMMEFHRGMLLCSPENAKYLLTCYVHPYLNDYYASTMSKSSLYRLNQRAIDEIVHCLGI